MKKIFLLILVIFIGCETVSVDNEEQPKNEAEAKTTENDVVTFSTVENDCQKIEALKSAYTKKDDIYYPNIPPVLIDAEEVFADVGMTGKKINEIPEAVKKAVVANIFDEEDTVEEEIETPAVEENEEVVVEEPKELKDEMVLLENEETEEEIVEEPIVEEKVVE